MKHYEHRIVDFLHTGALAANTVWTPTPLEIDVDEMGEVVWAEVYSPVALGGEELLSRWYLRLDGNNYDDHMSIAGTRSECVTPPKNATITADGIVAFGTPFVDAVKKAMPALENTCPKFKRTIGIQAWAGLGGITADFLVRLHCYIYRKEELPFIATEMPAISSIYDAPRRRTIAVNKRAVPVNYENWDNLPGGLDQSAPMIHPYWRWAANFIATTANTDYGFRPLLGTVDPAQEWQELYWNFESGEDVLIVKGIGVRPDAAGNLMETVLKIAGDDHPRYRIPTALDINNPLANAIHYGQIYPIDGVGDPWFRGIPKLDKNYVIYNEIGEINVRDGGVAVLANAIRVAMNGILIELV